MKLLISTSKIKLLFKIFFKLKSEIKYVLHYKKSEVVNVLYVLYHELLS